MVIYKITNQVNGKTYVGKTKNRPLTRFGEHKNDAKRGSDLPIHRAMRKYGMENFIFEIIDTAETHEELKVKEFKWIRDLNSRVDENGYNICYGDEEDNPKVGEESVIKGISTRKINTSKNYLGVRFHKDKKRWGFSMNFKGKNIESKRYDSEKDAAIGRDIKLCELWANDEICLKIMNFPELLPEIRSNKINNPIADRKIATKTSKYKGVSICHANGKWEATAVYKQKRYRITSFDTEEEAAEMADWIKIVNNIPSELNFPKEKYLKEGYQPPKTALGKNKMPKYVSSYVSTNGKTRYRTRITETNISECFDLLEDAVTFRDELLKNPEAIATAKAEFYAKKGKTVKIRHERVLRNLRS